MKNFLTEKLLLNSRYGFDCTLEVCTAGDPDKDTLIYKGSCGECLRKISTHTLSFGGDEYFCLYTNLGSYDGTDLDTVCHRMGLSPDSICEILGLNETAELSEDAKSPELTILSAEACSDKDYGETLVQYTIGDVISFALSQVPIETALAEPESLIADILDFRGYLTGQPLWSDLSPVLQDVILENPFDMFFIDEGEDDWTEEMSEVLWDEVQAMGIEGAVRCGEDGALVTVYAGAMSCINWAGHPEYGEPCFQYSFENNLPKPQKASLASLIHSAENRADAADSYAALRSKDLEH